MVYFFHHYELPVILQQAQLQQILRNHATVVTNNSSGDTSANQTGQTGDSGVGGAGNRGAGAAPGTGIVPVTRAGARLTARLTSLLSTVRPPQGQVGTTNQQTGNMAQATTQTTTESQIPAERVNIGSQVSFNFLNYLSQVWLFALQYLLN